MAGQLLIAQPMIAIVLGKATNFHCGLNGHRADNMKQTAQFQLQVVFCCCCFLRQKIVAVEENEKEVVSVEEDGQEAEVVSLGASRSVPPVWKSSKLHG